MIRRPADRDCDLKHASCVAFDGRAVLLLGASGSGKSGLALQLMAIGGHLVSDDRTCLWQDGAEVWADAPRALRGKIEARHVGILNADPFGPAKVVLCVDLDVAETQRLPEEHRLEICEIALPLLRHVQSQHFPAAIRQTLLSGRWA